MKLVAQGIALSALLVTAACNNPNRPTDVGSMATPTPPRPGIADPTVRQGRDVGSMSAPNQTGGIRVPGQTTPDTGNMAEPAAAAGALPSRRSTP